MSEEGRSDRTGLPDSLRAAVERTLAATADTASETAERAQELLDEVARQGQRTREGLAKIRLASADEVRELNDRLDRIEAKLETLQAVAGPTVASTEEAKAQPQPEN